MNAPFPIAPDAAIREAALAIDHSLILQAPAGSGKTTLLATRVLKLLTRVARPEEILAITFTRKAAAEMREKVLDLLSENNELAATVRARSAQLGWELQSNPARLQIQTIDGFALLVASAEPSSATLLGVQIEEAPADQYRAAAQRLFARLFDPDDPTASVVADFLAFLDNDVDRAVNLLVTMLAKRDQWLGTTLEVSQQADTTQAVALFLERTIGNLRAEYERALDAKLTPADRDLLRRLAEHFGTPDTVRDVLPPLLTGKQELRRRVTAKEGFSDKAWRIECSNWLVDAHEAGLAPLLETYAQLPEEALPEASLDDLRLVCLGLNLAAAILEAQMREEGRTDFTGLLLAAKRALRDEHGPTDLALRLDYRIKHILVDEFQDTSRSQLEFFRLLTEHWQRDELEPGETTFFAVGDPMQSIYRFRDADVAIFAESRRDGIGAVSLQALQLEANFRSSPVIVNWVNDTFSTLFAYDAVAPQPGQIDHGAAIPVREREVSDQVQCLHFTSAQIETQAILAHIDALRRVNPAASIAVLCHARSHVLELLEHLEARRIPWQANDMHRLDQEPVVEDLFSLYRTLLDPLDAIAWLALLRSPLVGLTLAELTALNRLPHKGRMSLHTLPPQPQVQRVIEAFEWAAIQRGEVPLREWLEGTWLRLGGPLCYETQDLAHAARWLDLVEQIGPRARNPVQLEQAMAGLFALSADDAPLQIMTIHKAKGLEFDHVIVPFLDRSTRNDDTNLLLMRQGGSGLLMGLKDDQVGKWLRHEERSLRVNEEKRLLYVAATRAKRSLWMSYALTDKGNAAQLGRWLAPFAQDGELAPAQPGPPAVKAQGQSDLFASQAPTMRFLDPDYRWQPQTFKTLPGNPAALREPDPIAGRQEVILGQLVHRALAWLGTLPELPNAAEAATLLAPRWSSWQDEASAATLLDQAQRQITSTLDDQTGRWIMTPRQASFFELSVGGILDERSVQRVFDRLFIEDGKCWIIDFKSTVPEQNSGHAEFARRESQRYHQQLSQYAVLAAQLTQLPTRTAIYFTALAEFVELDTAGQPQ
ncbi:MAG: UvrD-helicase domain-containing protein [Pseudomonadota bacterium]